MADLVAREAGDIAVERLPGADGIGDMLVLRAGPHNTQKSALVIAHLKDTVHPLGTAQTDLPVWLDGDRLQRPGRLWT